MKYPLLALIRLYQWTISPLLGPVCRFYPSCSRYAYEAIATHGAVYGSYLAVRRLLRCHPWNPGGLDPVPPRAQRPRRASPLMCRSVVAAGSLGAADCTDARRLRVRDGPTTGPRHRPDDPETSASARPAATTPPQGDPR